MGFLDFLGEIASIVVSLNDTFSEESASRGTEDNVNKRDNQNQDIDNGERMVSIEFD